MVDWKVIVAGSVFTAVLVSMSVGMYFAGYNNRPGEASRLDVTQTLLDEIQAENIGENLRILTSVPHLGGTPEDLSQAQWVREKFIEAGFDEATVVPYDVLLSYPDQEQPNKVYLLSEDGSVLFETKGTQTPIYAPEEGLPNIMPNFNAYSAQGEVEGEMVYVYYGREDDYKILLEKNIDIKGKIVLARYGAIFRGNIVAIAEKMGAVGVVLYSDPKDYAPQSRDFVYANSVWMPGMAVQSGTTFLGNGDPLTPFYPAVESAYRLDQTDANLPKIPVQPIGYDEAEHFLKNMITTHLAPEEWQGELNSTYYLGPGFQADRKVKLHVRTSNKIATIHNTIGIIYGDVEPDRYVLVGNHRDAWGLGAIDPSSGTASMIEMARAFGAIKSSQNWRPRRSLVFCSWGAEEYGLIGSYEWVEQHAKVLSQRAVAYLNVDIAVSGNYSLTAAAVPMLRQLLIDSSKKIPNPSVTDSAAGQTTLFDKWAASFPNGATGQPEVGDLGSGSDHTSFIHCLGIPSLDMTYKSAEYSNYPLYHTLYETYHLVSYLLDPGFLYHRAVTQLWAEIARNLAESDLLPFDVKTYATYMRSRLTALQTRYSTQMEEAGATFDYFDRAVSGFDTSVDTYLDTTSKADRQNSLVVRRINDQLMQLERHFIDPRGLPDRPKINHLVFAPSSSDTYSSSSFSGLTDLLESVAGQSQAQNPEAWKKIKQHLSVIAFHIDAAARSLRDAL